MYKNQAGLLYVPTRARRDCAKGWLGLLGGATQPNTRLVFQEYIQPLGTHTPPQPIHLCWTFRVPVHLLRKTCSLLRTVVHGSQDQIEKTFWAFGGIKYNFCSKCVFAHLDFFYPVSHGSCQFAPSYALLKNILQRVKIRPVFPKSWS